MVTVLQSYDKVIIVTGQKFTSWLSFICCSYAAGVLRCAVPLSVRSSVRLSNAWIVAKRKKLLPTFLHRSMHLVLRYEEWLVENVSSTCNFPPNWPILFKKADFQSIFARSASAVTPSERSSIMTNPLYGFPMSIRWTAYVASKPHPAVWYLCDSWDTC